MSEKYYHNSPYAFSENKVISHREIEGLEASWSISTQSVSGVNSKTVWDQGDYAAQDVTFTLTTTQTTVESDQNVVLGTTTITSTSVHTIRIFAGNALAWVPDNTPKVQKQNTAFITEVPVQGSDAIVVTTKTPVSTNNENPKTTTTTSTQKTGTVILNAENTKKIKAVAKNNEPSVKMKYLRFISSNSRKKPVNPPKYRQDVPIR